MPLVAAQSGHITLLTVAEAGNEKIGGVADLYLEIESGSGRIFIDSFPLTKLDTQISTRFANEIACQQLDLDCSKKDFFYTISADSTIVGGPSAGSGVAVLTAAVMKGLELDPKIAITGTMNSGGIIGPVAGVAEKVDAAAEAGLTKVVIPSWVSYNETGSRIEVVRAGNLEEALLAFTGMEFNGMAHEIEISEKYQDRMEAVADILCERATSLEHELENNGKEYNDSSNYTARTESALNNSKFYTAASFCFSRNVELRQEFLEDELNLNLLLKVRDLSKAIGKLDKESDERQLLTLSDLETYMIVKERLVEAAQMLSKINLGNISTPNLGYAIERYFSAVAWSNFFGLGGKKYSLNNQYLSIACQQKISEAEERLDYVGTIRANILAETQAELDLAYKDRRDKNYPLCMFKASKAKAEADMFLLAISVKEEDVNRIVGGKLLATKRVILEQQENEIFPILGYSYYEYADSLKEANPSSALLFSEYALEMSNLNMYFPQEEEEESWEFPDLDLQLIILFMWGIIIGFLIAQLVQLKPRKKSKN
ncbi:S16 family serine protease [Nanoarchaeota archaeon]